MLVDPVVGGPVVATCGDTWALVVKSSGIVDPVPLATSIETG